MAFLFVLFNELVFWYPAAFWSDGIQQGSLSGFELGLRINPKLPHFLKFCINFYFSWHFLAWKQPSGWKRNQMHKVNSVLCFLQPFLSTWYVAWTPLEIERLLVFFSWDYFRFVFFTSLSFFWNLVLNQWPLNGQHFLWWQKTCKVNLINRDSFFQYSLR